MKKRLLALALLLSTSLHATEMTISVELPEHQYEGRFYPPFVTGWIERDKKVVDTLFIWYYPNKENPEKAKEWLRTLKKWWRRGGRNTNLDNLDAVAGATKKPGTHVETFVADDNKMLKLRKETEYKLVIEASREKGTNESIEIPFTLSDTEASLEAKGEAELGNIQVTIKP